MKVRQDILAECQKNRIVTKESNWIIFRLTDKKCNANLAAMHHSLTTPSLYFFPYFIYKGENVHFWWDDLLPTKVGPSSLYDKHYFHSFDFSKLISFPFTPEQGEMMGKRLSLSVPNNKYFWGVQQCRKSSMMTFWCNEHGAGIQHKYNCFFWVTQTIPTKWTEKFVGFCQICTLHKLCHGLLWHRMIKR